MDKLYQSAWDKVEMSADRKSQIRQAIQEAEPVVSVKRRQHAWVKTAAAAAVFVAVLLVVPGTSSVVVKATQSITRVFTMLSGGTLTVEQGVDYTSVSAEGNRNELERVVEISDGRVYFVMDGSRLDITDQCREDQYFRYEEVTEDGRQHVVFVGGASENVGWAEFIFDEDGTYLNNLMYIPNAVEPAGPAWLLAAERSIGVPTGTPELDSPQ